MIPAIFILVGETLIVWPMTVIIAIKNLGTSVKNANMNTFNLLEAASTALPFVYNAHTISDNTIWMSQRFTFNVYKELMRMNQIQHSSLIPQISAIRAWNFLR